MARKAKVVAEKVDVAPVAEPKAAESVAPVVKVGPRKVIVSPAELAKLQEDGLLIGYNPATGEALIK